MPIEIVNIRNDKNDETINQAINVMFGQNDVLIVGNAFSFETPHVLLIENTNAKELVDSNSIVKDDIFSSVT